MTTCCADSRSRTALPQRRADRERDAARRRSHPDRIVRTELPSARQAPSAHGVASGASRAFAGARRGDVDGGAAVWSMTRGKSFIRFARASETQIGRATRQRYRAGRFLGVASSCGDRSRSNGSFRLRDLGSQNGTFVARRAGQRRSAEERRRGAGRRRFVYLPCLRRSFSDRPRFCSRCGYR